MNRLTFHENDNCSFNIDQDFSMEESKGYWLKNEFDLEKSICKLGQLEDIEEELGIDLITLFKAHKNGIYVKNCDYKIIDVDIVFKDRCSPRYSIECVVKGMETTLNLKDYGKTWALSKQELEKKL